MRVNDVHSKSTFGMAIKVQDSQSLVRLRSFIRTTSDEKKLAKLLQSQENNNFHINLGFVTSGGKERLRGYIYDGYRFYREPKELNESAVALNPLKFIEKICKIADNVAEEYEARCITNNFFKKINR